MTRRIIQNTLLSLAAVVFIHPAFCEHPDLSGTWTLDTTASSFGGRTIPESGLMTISTGPHKMLHMEVVLKGPAGAPTIERADAIDWKTDDKYHPVVGSEPGTALAKWEGSMLVGKRHTENGMEEIRLLPGAGGLSLVESIETPQGRTTLMWRRQ